MPNRMYIIGSIIGWVDYDSTTYPAPSSLLIQRVLFEAHIFSYVLSEGLLGFFCKC